MGRLSRKSDVFSYGVMLLEVFTGKRPTDPMFVGELDIRRCIHQAIPTNVMYVVDEQLQQDPAGSLNDFLIPVLEIGLLCSASLTVPSIHFSSTKIWRASGGKRGPARTVRGGGQAGSGGRAEIDEGERRRRNEETWTPHVLCYSKTNGGQVIYKVYCILREYCYRELAYCGH